MRILAVEFSTGRRSVAVSEGGARLSSASEQGGRHTRAFALIEKALAEAGLEREQIGCLAIGTGPGSYTGIRAAISLAQGWQLALQVRLLGVSTMDCLAQTAVQAGLKGRGRFVIDAQRGEVYLAGYEIFSDGFKLWEPLRIVPANEPASLRLAGEFLAGPEISRWIPDGQTLFPEADALAAIAAQRADFVAGEKLEPIYLRETAFVKAPPPRIVP